jgi:hypothetical protein
MTDISENPLMNKLAEVKTPPNNLGKRFAPSLKKGQEFEGPDGSTRHLATASGGNVRKRTFVDVATGDE